MDKSESLGRWRLAQRFLGVLYPPRCPVCDGLLKQQDAVYRHGPGVHPHCAGELAFAAEPVCMRCGRPVPSDEDEFCRDCAGKRHVEGFRQGKSLMLYQGEARRMLYRFKYKTRREYASWFASLAVQLHGSWLMAISPEVIVPVPMFPPKQRRRGYNQAAVFARELSRLTGLPWNGDLVTRVRDTRPMKELDDLARRENLRGAFLVAGEAVRGRSILLVDDIYTTGITAEEVSAALLGAGAGIVYYMSITIGKGY